ncbi:MAG: hypothetical protein R2724_02915 [Bryobacterales bacterium]
MVALRSVERALGRIEVGANGLLGLIDDAPDADGGGKVHDDIGAVAELVENTRARHIAHTEGKARMT